MANMMQTSYNSHLAVSVTADSILAPFSCVGNGLAPMGLLFQFLSLLRAQPPQKWVFDELANIAQMRFKFAEEEDACEYALRLAADAPYYAPEHLLNGLYLYDQWDPQLVRHHHHLSQDALLPLS